MKIEETIERNPKNVVSVKVEENQEVETQKAEHNSSQSQRIVKEQAESDSEKDIQYRKKTRKERQIAEDASKRNETKNISKNFGKAVLSFAKSNTKFAKKLLKKYNIQKQDLIVYIKKARKNLNSLQDLREMWGAGDQQHTMKKCLRVASYHFMRKHCLEYIFNSRIRSVSAHTKYRHRLMQGMRNPSEFTNIKVN